MKRSNCKIKILSPLNKEITLDLQIPHNYKFIDLFKVLKTIPCHTIHSGFLFEGKYITNKNSNDNLVDVMKNNELIIRERSFLTPKNLFHEIGTIITLDEYNLGNTINLYDVCPINHAKIGEWIGWGRGPTTIPITEDNNKMRNLIFIIVDNQSFVYNIHCLYNLINNDDNTLLIPHLNKKVDSSKFRDLYLGKKKTINILRLNSNELF